MQGAKSSEDGEDMRMQVHKVHMAGTLDSREVPASLTQKPDGILARMTQRILLGLKPPFPHNHEDTEALKQADTLSERTEAEGRKLRDGIIQQRPSNCQRPRFY